MHEPREKTNLTETSLKETIDDYSIKCATAERENKVELRRELGRQKYYFKVILERITGEWYYSKNETTN